MEFEDYQHQADKFSNSQVKGIDQYLMGALGLTGEAGELADEIKKVVFHNKPLDVDVIAKELGDVLWYLSYLCSVFKLDLREVAKRNIKKLTNRHGDSFKPHDQQNR